MKVYRDTKVTIWEREYFDVPDKTPKKKIIEMIQSGGVEQYDAETLHDTTEELTVEENGGFATIEIYKDNHKLLFANGKH